MALRTTSLRQLPVLLLRVLVVVLVRETGQPRYDSTEHLLSQYDFIIGMSMLLGGYNHGPWTEHDCFIGMTKQCNVHLILTCILWLRNSCNFDVTLLGHVRHHCEQNIWVQRDSVALGALRADSNKNLSVWRVLQWAEGRRGA